MEQALSIDVVVATFGDLDAWRPMAERALVSVEDQTVPPHAVHWQHGETLAQARNDGAGMCTGRFLCFLDADDELDPDFIEAMQAAIVMSISSSPVLFQPATLGCYPDGSEDEEAVVIPAAPLLERNFLVVSTLVSRAMFMHVGGFGDDPVLEDWDLMIRLQLAGCRPVAVPGAVLRVGVNNASRNQDAGLHSRVYRQIRERYKEFVRA